MLHAEYVELKSMGVFHRSVLSVTKVDGNVTWGLKSMGVLHGVCVVCD